MTTARETDVQAGCVNVIADESGVGRFALDAVDGRRVRKLDVVGGVIAGDPCPLTATKRRRGYLSHEQVHDLVEAAGDWGDILAVLAYTGLRWGELAALRLSSVDLRSGRLAVTASVSEIGGTLAWGTPKNDQSRSVVLPPFLMPALERRITERRPDDLVFTTYLGTPLRNNNFRHRVFSPALKRVRENDPTFPVVTPHDLRHTAASLAVSAGANVKAVQHMLGHASAAMTLDVYADLFDEDLNAVAEALDHKAAGLYADKIWTLEEPSPSN